MKFRQTYNSFFVWKMQKSSNLFWVSCRENFLSLGLSGLPDRSLNSEHSGRVVSKGVLSRLGQIYLRAAAPAADPGNRTVACVLKELYDDNVLQWGGNARVAIVIVH